MSPVGRVPGGWARVPGGGGGWERTQLDDLIDVYERESRRDVIAMDIAIAELKELNPRPAAVVRLRFFSHIV